MKKTELTYQKEVEKNPMTETVTIKVPSNWGMYTTYGNQALKRKADSLVANILKVVNSKGSFSDLVKCFEKYFNSYETTARNSKTSEACDTSVREQVWCFSVNVGKSVNVGEETLDSVWVQRRPKKNK